MAYMSNEIFESNLLHFKIVKRYRDKVQCTCPAHNDQKASLTISLGKKCTLFHCHAGCSLDAVLSAAGLEKKDTFYDSKPQVQHWKVYIENREKRKIEAVYHYVSCNDGTYAFTKVRLEGKKMLYGILENERFSYGLPSTRPRKSYRAIYGNVEAIQKAIQDGQPIFIPEGEKDVCMLKRQGYTAFTYGGSTDWQSELSELVKGANVIILADNDAAGKNVANTILQDVSGIVKSAKIVVPMPDIPKADITDFFEAGHTKQEFDQMINNVTEERMGAVQPPQQAQKRTLDKVLRDLHAESFEASDKGFGRLFATVYKDKHRYNSSRKDFMQFDGKRWMDDTEGLSARASAKDLSDALIKYAITVDSDGKYLKAVAPLCNIRNRNNMLQDSRDEFYFNL